MILRGEGMYLRPMEEKDTELIIKWRNQPFVQENFIYQKPFTKEGHLHWIETMIKTGRAVQFILCTDQDEPVGSVYLRDIDREHRKAEYGIFIGEKKALSRGLGTGAARLIIAYAFDTLGLHKVMLRVLAGNERARRSYEKAGFVQEACLKDEVYLKGSYRDVILMAAVNQTERNRI